MATMQQVAQAATHPTIALANAKTIQNKQYNRISPGCAAIKLATMLKLFTARQRRRYITGSMKLANSDHMSTRTIITNTHAAIIEIRYTSCTLKKFRSPIVGIQIGSESRPAKISSAKPTINEKKKKLLPSFRNSRHGSAIAPRFFTIQSVNMKPPRARSQATSRRTKQTRMQMAVTRTGCGIWPIVSFNFVAPSRRSSG